ncbi:hypothetical protein SDC9_148267 [bioreactor metagenome]|uniref:3-oxoacyl-[acyl-carrier-protein] reductase FabG n=2 Tax=root TaxID=1 RepID=A0A645EH45_9ZZZZ
MLTASYVSTIIGMLIPGNGALWTSQSIEFIHPVFIGDTITVSAKVKQISKSTRTLVLDIIITNQHKQIVVTGESKVKLLELKNGEGKVTDLDRKLVLITGGSRGIGAEIARKLSREGHTVLINYRCSEVEANRLVAEIQNEGGKAYCFKADVSIMEEVEEMFNLIRQEVGEVQAVIHCAAPDSVLKPFEETDWTDIQKHLDIQVKGAYNCVRSSITNMIKAASGLIIFIGSVAINGVPPMYQTDYVIGKTALASLAKSLANEYGPKGIRVNIVSPGMTQTERIEKMPEKAKMIYRMQTPLRRLGTPGEVADVIAFLLEPGARFITGENIRVCGGAVME